MNKTFIDNMIDAYFLDNKIYESENITKEFVANKFLQDLREVREDDIDLYDEIYNLDKTCQYKFIKEYLDTYLKEPQECDQETIEESILGLTAGAIKSIAAFMTTTPMLLLTSGIVLTLMITKPGSISNATFKTLSKVNDVFVKIGKSISKLGATSRMRYIVIKRNTEQCYKKCGINPKDVRISHYIGTTKKEPWWGALSNRERANTGECLRECYITNMINVIDLYMKNYFECLQKSGVDITDAENDIMKFISRIGSSSVCQGFYNEAKESYEMFEKILDLSYSEPIHQQGKQQHIKELRERLYKSRVEAQRKFPQKQNKRY
ncbi:MAG: hypothetical protein ACOC33_00830 [bacterium]